MLITNADVAELVDALVLGTSVNDVGVRVPSSAPSNRVDTMNLLFYFSLYFKCTLHKFDFNFQLCYNYCILLHKEELEMEQRNLEDLVDYLSEKCKKTLKKRTRNHEKTRFYNEALQFLEEVNHLKRLISNVNDINTAIENGNEPTHRISQDDEYVKHYDIVLVSLKDLDKILKSSNLKTCLNYKNSSCFYTEKRNKKAYVNIFEFVDQNTDTAVIYVATRKKYF